MSADTIGHQGFRLRLVSHGTTGAARPRSPFGGHHRRHTGMDRWLVLGDIRLSGFVITSIRRRKSGESGSTAVEYASSEIRTSFHPPDTGTFSVLTGSLAD